ncbi:MAG: hypothetical protein Q8O95_05475 [bacterium]|nr:hypothetical protein [bacterium]
MYQLVLHKTLTLEKWRRFSIDRHILMIANEVNRLQNSFQHQFSTESIREIFERAFELIDMMIWSQSGNLRKELLRWRELFSELYVMDRDTFDKSFKPVQQMYRVLLLLNHQSAQLLAP